MMFPCLQLIVLSLFDRSLAYLFGCKEATGKGVKSVSRCAQCPEVCSGAGYREPAKPSRRPEDEEADIEAQLEKERQEMLQSGKVTGAAAPQGEMLVLKVVCKHGHAQIRQPKDGDFVSLHDKFKKYAIQQNWATKSTKVHLTCDDEDVDIYNSTPDDFDLEDGMTIDVVLK